MSQTHTYSIHNVLFTKKLLILFKCLKSQQVNFKVKNLINILITFYFLRR